MRNAVLQKFLPVADESVPGVHLFEIGLRVDPAGVAAHLGEGRLHQPRGVPVTAVGAVLVLLDPLIPIPFALTAVFMALIVATLVVHPPVERSAGVAELG